MDLDPQAIRDWGQASKALIELFRTVLPSIPSGEKRAEYESKLRIAEEAQRRADAVLAQQLGYLICKCTFPPNPMLWRQSQQIYECEVCGNRTDPPSEPRAPRFGTMA